MMRLLLRRFPAAGGLLWLAPLGFVALAGPKYLHNTETILIVTNTADSGTGSLRATIAAANDGDAIQFDPALNGQIISLTSGELAINKNITIDGPGSNLLTVSKSAGSFRIFHVMPGHTVTIEGLTIQNGSGTGGGVLNDHSTLTIDSCIVSGNFAPDSQGGGLYNNGSGSSARLTILNSTISGNQALSTVTLTAGGGIANDGSNGGSPTLTILNSLVNGNLAKFDQGISAFGGNGGGIYNNGASATLEITNSSVNSNGVGHLPGESGQTFGFGGGIWNSGVATIRGSTVNGNVAGHGGGIDNSGTLTITGSTVNGNSVGGIVGHSQWGEGGGIDSSGTVTITNTTLRGNSAFISGGALYGNGMITNCTISANQSFNGGGIYGSPTVTNSTISGNIAGFGTLGGSGGGIYGGGIIQHCTIAGNTGGSDGGLYVWSCCSLEIANTILKTGGSGASIYNLGGAITSHGYNISNDNGGGFLTATGDQINTDPLLGPLQNNGGPTFTHDLLAGSPALDAGNPSFTPPPSTDQRGYARLFNGRVDIGSLEVQPTPPPITISGTIAYCSNPVPGPVPNVTLTLTGSTSGSTLSNSSGNYQFSSLPSGASYTVTPSKATRLPGSAGIDTVDVVATQRHFLIIGTPLTGCRLTAADVNGDSAVNTIDVVAIQRFFLIQSTGIANVGKYQFNPPNRTYLGVVTDQTNQNYDALIFGDVVSPFAEP